MIAATLFLTIVCPIAGQSDPLQARIEAMKGTSVDARAVISGILERAKVSFVIHNDVSGRVTFDLPADTGEATLYRICSGADAAWEVPSSGVYRVYRPRADARWYKPSSTSVYAESPESQRLIRRAIALQIDRVTLRNASPATAFSYLFSMAKLPFVVSTALKGNITADLSNLLFEKALREICIGFDATFQFGGGVCMIVPMDPRPTVGVPPP